MKKIISILLILLFMQMQVLAQTLPQGTLVIVQPSKIIDADDVQLGDTVSFTTLKPVKVNGKVVINQGTEVTAKVTKRKNNGILGIPGEIEISDFMIVTQNNEIIHLCGVAQNKGDGRYWANAGWVFIITIPLLFIKGNDGKILTNTSYMLYTAEDVNL